MSGDQASADKQSIRFILDGEVIALTDVDPTRTVLQYLREDLGRTGTKEGCAEGDCGACTVALVEADRCGSGLRIRAVNSCIQFLPTLDGCELITIESLRASDGTLHPAQRAMVDCHGSQCGFCTPGFVMSLFVHYKNCGKPTRQEVDDVLAGNLCRCTGYQPIIDAAQKMYDLKCIDGDNWLHQGHDLRPTAADQCKFEALANLGDDQSLSLKAEGRYFDAPRHIQELAGLVEQFPDATILAGGTDVGLWVTKQHKHLQRVIYIGQVDALSIIAVNEDFVDIGAAVTLTDAMPILDTHFPSLHDLFMRFASPPVRNAATLVGNVANGSPIGDSMPALLALDATLVLRKGSSSRTMPLSEFYLGYQKTALAKGEFIERLQIPISGDNTVTRCYKVSKRFDQDISAVCGAFQLRLKNERVGDIRIAYGGLAATPKRAVETERMLKGVLWNEENIRAAMNKLSTEFQPISDMRSSAAYRLRVCQNLLYRFWLEQSDDSVATDVYRYGR